MRRTNILLRLALMMALALRCSVLLAQQDPLYSQYMFNTLAFNPAYAGSGDVWPSD